MAPSGKIYGPPFDSRQAYMESMLQCLVNGIGHHFTSSLCLLIYSDPENAFHRCITMQEATANQHEENHYGMGHNFPFIEDFLSFPKSAVVVSNIALSDDRQSKQHIYCYDRCTKEPLPINSELCAKISAVLDVDHYLSVPLPEFTSNRGRLFVGSSERPFTSSDADFVIHFFDCLRPLLDFFRQSGPPLSLQKRDERKAIARDIHDVILQHFIALQMGLYNLKDLDISDTHFSQTKMRMSRMVDQLAETVDGGILEVREFIRELRGSPTRHGSFHEQLQQLAESFSKRTEIAVSLEIEPGLSIPDALGVELLRMVTEGLSNINRHTASHHAIINLNKSDQNIKLSIVNDVPLNHSAAPFTPDTLNERTSDLGGELTVKVAPVETMVILIIPLPSPSLPTYDAPTG